MKKQLGIGSLSFVLTAFALLLSCNLNGFCLGDFLLGTFGLNAWSSGPQRVHYPVFLSLLLYLPAYYLGVKYSDHLFAKTGRMLSGILGVYLAIIGCAILIWW